MIDGHTAAVTAALFALGVGASVFGSIVGLGGGFIVVPFLRLAFGASPALAAATALTLVLGNVMSATIALVRAGRVDVRFGFQLAAGAIPGTFAGVAALRLVSPTGFDAVYALLLFTLSGLLYVRSRRADDGRPARAVFATLPATLALGAAVGIASTFFGVGGGIVLVPALVLIARMPAHVVAATSQFVILLTVPVGIAVHVAAGHFALPWALPMFAGGLVGGSIGPQIAQRISSGRLVALLALAMLASAASLVVRHLV